MKDREIDGLAKDVGLQVGTNMAGGRIVIHNGESGHLREYYGSFDTEAEVKAFLLGYKEALSSKRA